jgi:hypothetical protein
MMTDIRVDEPDAREPDPQEPDGGERLPWLEAADQQDQGDGPSALKLIAWVIVGLVAIGGIVGGLFWIGNRHAAGQSVQTIAAPQTPYKVKPRQPGGMRVDGTGETAFAASAGAEPKGRIDLNGVPEAPVARAAAQPPRPAATAAARPPQPAGTAPASIKAAAAQTAHSTAQIAAAPPKPRPAPSAAGGGGIQLGAFSSQAGADKAWKALSGRFSYLAPLSHRVVSVSSGGKTLYRLRASGPDAAGICGRLKVAGESCVTLD